MALLLSGPRLHEALKCMYRFVQCTFVLAPCCCSVLMLVDAFIH
jgi:hypothetical protein